MNGQWIGEYTGSNSGEITTGTIIVNIDEYSQHYEGIIYLYEKDIPGTGVYFKSPNKLHKFEVSSNATFIINPDNGYADNWDNHRERYPDLNLANKVNISFEWKESELKINWKTDNEINGECKITRPHNHESSSINAITMTWDEYKSYVSTLIGHKKAFRGQSEPWALRSSFHRTGRANTNRYISEDIPLLYRQLSSKTKHIFNLDVPNQNGAFHNLLQHHGYPTPLLDWTYSPYVAAFFAFRGFTKNDSRQKDKKTRIYIFNQLEWKNDWRQLDSVDTAFPHLSIKEFIGIDNERMIPQQAISTITNIEDIERYIAAKEQQSKKQYLEAIDIHWSERSKVFEELAYMGITAGSLFPGLDGLCEELKEKNFFI